MTPSELQSIIDLHQKAFAFLLACGASGHAASRPFDEATIAAWQHSDTCLQWVTRHFDELPVIHRPAPSEVASFSEFLVSFFATSFSILRPRRTSESTRIQIRALPGHRPDGSRISKRAIGKEQKTADTLRRLALAALAAEAHIICSEEQQNLAMNDPAFALDLTLWTYALQLVSRSQFASQGPAVYQLWLNLPEKTRRSLSAATVWQARARLLESLQSFSLNTLDHE